MRIATCHTTLCGLRRGRRARVIVPDKQAATLEACGVFAGARYAERLLRDGRVGATRRWRVVVGCRQGRRPFVCDTHVGTCTQMRASGRRR